MRRPLSVSVVSYIPPAPTRNQQTHCTMVSTLLVASLGSIPFGAVRVYSAMGRNVVLSGSVSAA